MNKIVTAREWVFLLILFAACSWGVSAAGAVDFLTQLLAIAR